MAEIDEFATDLLEEAKRFLELAKVFDGKQDEVGRQAYLHASIMLGFCGLEAHVNAVADEMCMTKGLSVHDKAILQEKDIKLEDGKFKLKGELKIYRLEDRILFLHARFSAQPLETSSWLPALKEALKLRNLLTHPKAPPLITVANAGAGINSIIETIDALYLAIYKKKFPAKIRGLQSRFEF